MKDSDSIRLTVIDGAKQSESETRKQAGILAGELQAKTPQKVVKEIVLSRPQPQPLTPGALAAAIAGVGENITDVEAPFEAKIARLLHIGRTYFGQDIGLLARFSHGHMEIAAVDSTVPVDRDGIELRPGGTFSLEGTFCASALQQPEPLAFDRSEHPALENRNLHRDSYIGCSVRMRESLWGTVSFSSCRPRGSGFTEEEKSFVALIARCIESDILRRQMKEELAFRKDFENLVLSLSRDFINLAPGDVDEGIRGALQRIGLFAAVDFSYVFLLKNNDTKMDISHWWAADNRTPSFRLRDISVEKYQLVMSRVLNREVVDFHDTSALPPGIPERRFAEAQKIRSAMLVPMVYSGNCIGLVGFAWREVRRRFDEEIVKLLKMVGHILASAVEFKRSQEAVQTLQEQMLHAQKLESLGRLAGGVAHDFNNLLMSILGNAGIAMRDLPAGAPARSSVARIERIAQDAAELTGHLLAYAGKGKFVTQTFNLADCVESMRDLLRRAISKKHKIVWNFAQDLPMIDGDPSQISQMIMNLVTNASEAIGDKSGTITISTGLLAVDRNYLLEAYLRDGTPEGVYVYVRVADTGAGMTKETQSRIFDPFYSTKPGGSGLGLAAVIGIARAHRGTVRVQSVSGEGSSFTVLFPCSGRQYKADQSRAKDRTLPAAKPAVLVVDDEEDVREVVSGLLTRCGYQVIDAADARSAAEQLRKSSGVGLAIVDMTMPDVDGEQLADELRRIREIPVILTSGYREKDIAQRLEGKGYNFIQKPYPSDLLLQKVEQLLSQQ